MWEQRYGCSPFIEDVQEIIDQQFSHAVSVCCATSFALPWASDPHGHAPLFLRNVFCFDISAFSVPRAEPGLQPQLL